MSTLDAADSRIEIEMTVERGRGYLPADMRDSLPIGEIPVDAIFTPVPKVNYVVENTRIGQTTDFDRLLNELPGRERRRIWWAGAGYVRSQAWQLALLLDLRRNWKRGLPPGSGALSHLARHERWFDRLTDHAGGRLAALLLTWGWFRLARRYHRA